MLSPSLQAWLQEVAWTEAEEPECLAVRNARARGKEELDLLQREPMFCFETALKLIKWSGLTYTDVGQDSWRPSDNAQGAPEAVLVKGRLQAPASWPSSSEGIPWICCCSEAFQFIPSWNGRRILLGRPPSHLPPGLISP